MQTTDIMILLGCLVTIVVISFFILYYSKKDINNEGSQEGDTPIYVEDTPSQGASPEGEISGDQPLF